MKISKNTKRSLVFGGLILLAALIGQRVAHGYIHPADPIIILAAMMLPLPHALAAVGIASVAADLIKGFWLLAPATLIIKLLMVWVVKALLKTGPAQKHPELISAVPLFFPVPGYYLSESINQLIQGKGLAAFGEAAVTLQADLVQAAAGVLVLVFVYDLLKGIKAGRDEVRRLKEEKKEEPKE
ncbi:MAG: ECF transporter S component [Clostridia bacterium]|nr:ECF transporter S component [Clostridia bacterium]